LDVSIRTCTYDLGPGIAGIITIITSIHAQSDGERDDVAALARGCDHRLIDTGGRGGKECGSVEKERLARGSRSKEQKFIDHDRQVARMRAWI